LGNKIHGKLCKERAILVALRDIIMLDLSPDHSSVEDVWQQAFKLINQLQQDLALLEVQLEVAKVI
jgi:hypothetical protein